MKNLLLALAAPVAALILGTATAATITSTHYVTVLPMVGEECAVLGETCRDGSIFMYEPGDGTVVRAVTATLEVTRRWDSASCVNCGAGNIGGSSERGYDNTYDYLWNYTDDQKTEVGLSGYFEAAAYCASLTAHGHSDWHLPSSSENFYTILLARAECIARTGSANQCPGAGPYWSSVEVNATQAMARSLTGGFNYNSLTVDKSSSYRVRCVRRIEAE